MKFHNRLYISRGSFRAGSTCPWEPVNFEESYAEVKIFDKNITEYLIISYMQNLGTHQWKSLKEPLTSVYDGSNLRIIKKKQLLNLKLSENVSDLFGKLEY